MHQTNNFLFKSLNNAQLKAVNHINGPLLFVAGSGSGQTKALTHSIASLIENTSVDPYNILAVTFQRTDAKDLNTELTVQQTKENAITSVGQHV